MAKKAAKRHQEQLERIKTNVEEYYNYFLHNYKNWHDYKKFIYVTALDKTDLAILSELNKPALEFNILEAFISKQKGEFAKQEPSIKVEEGDDIIEVDPEQIAIVEGYMRHMEREMRENNTAYCIIDDMLSGGFSCADIYTDYANEMSFNHKIIVERSYDPTLCGFDPMAVLPHKGDGQYCFAIVPMSKKIFEEKYGKKDLSKCVFSTNLNKFSWSYLNKTEEIILVCTYNEKVKKRTKIVQLSDNRVMTDENYTKMLAEWEKTQRIEQPPVITGERISTFTDIDRYIYIENEVLEYKKTDYSYLPKVFFDGNSVSYRESIQGEMKQVTRPYWYQAKGLQKLKNFCGITLTNEIENMIQHKWKIPVEGIPEEYEEAYEDVQQASVLMYNQFMDNDPDKRLDPPQEIPRVPTPPEVIGAFQSADQMAQVILGSRDSAMNTQRREVSGAAVIELASDSNITAMPYIVGYLSGFSQLALIGLDLLTKYYKSSRNIPIVDKNGERKYVKINQAGKKSIDFTPTSLNVNVMPGVNFSVQKTKALQQMTGLMQASTMFSEFINTTPEGLRVLLDNMEMRGIDNLKDSVEKFIIKYNKKQEQKEAAEMKNNPVAQKLHIEQMKLVQNEVHDKRDEKLKAAQLAINDKNADSNRLKVLSDIGSDATDKELKQDQIDAENARTSVEMVGKSVDRAMGMADMAHRHKYNRDKDNNISPVDNPITQDSQ